MTKRDLRWWALCITHNCLVHPMLPIADFLESLKFKRVSEAIYWLHDNSFPEE